MSATSPPPAAMPPPKTPPPPPPSRPPANGVKPAAAPVSKRSFSVTAGVRSKYQRTVIYGPGGAGKSELCSHLKQLGIRPLFLDVGNGTGFLDVERIDGLASWDELRGALHDADLWKGFGAVVVDDLTKAEELAIQWTLDNVPRELKDGTKERVDSVEGYGWGKGYMHVYETFLHLLGDLDAHIRAGRQVICVAHECTASVPNPSGEDFLRYEPRLQAPASGKSSIRHRVKEWCDHMLFVGFDVFVKKDGKAQGSGTRTIYPTEMPTHWAKSRSLADPIHYERGSAELWRKLLTDEAK